MATAVVNVALPKLAPSINTVPIQVGAFAATLPQFTAVMAASSAGGGSLSATMAVALPQLISAMSAAPPMTASISTSLPQLSASVNAAHPVIVSITAALPQLTVAFAAQRMNVATIRIKYALNMGTLNFGVSGSGGVAIPARKGAYVYNDPSINVASGGVSIGGAATVVIPSNFIESGEGGMLVSGAAGVRSYALNPLLAMSLPAIKVSLGSLNSGILAVTTPRMRANLTGLVGRVGVLALTAPSMRVAMSGGASKIEVTLPAQRVLMSGNQVYVGNLDVRAPAIRAALSGNPALTGSMSVRMGAPTVSMSGAAGIGGALALALPATRVAMTGNPGVRGTLALSFAAPKVALTGTMQIVGSLSVAIPKMRADLIGTLRTQLMLMLVANTSTGALSTYAGLQVNSMCQFGDTVLFADATGIHVMDADDDNNAPIDASVQYGVLDMGSAMQKHVTDVYVGMRAAGDLALSVSVDEKGPYGYTLSPHGVETLKARRVATGKGLRGKYWQFGITNVNGCDFDLDAIDISVADSARRI